MCRYTSARLESFKGDFLRFVERGSVDGLELGHEFLLQGIVIGVRPGSVFLEWLGDRNLEIQASTAYLTRDLGSGECLELRQVFVQQSLAGLEAF